MTEKKSTHKALAFFQEGPRGMGRLVEIGQGWLPPGQHTVQLDRMPMGGLKGGWVHFVEKTEEETPEG